MVARQAGRQRKLSWRKRWLSQGLRPDFAARYDYVNDEDSLCFWKRKFNLVDLSTGDVVSKTFTTQSFVNPLRRDSAGEYEKDELVNSLLPKYQGLIFNQFGVRDAIALGKPIWWCEGEKDATNARVRYGFEEQEFTSSYQGSDPINARQAKVLCGAEQVRFVIDRDGIGPLIAYRNAVEVSKFVHRNRIRFFLPAVHADKADLSDHVRADYRLCDLEPASEAVVRQQALQALERETHLGAYGSRGDRRNFGSDSWTINGEFVDWSEVCASWAAGVEKRNR
jgi:hypothetical protein